MNIVAVCDEGPSLTLLATLFRVNNLEGEGRHVHPVQEFEAEDVFDVLKLFLA